MPRKKTSKSPKTIAVKGLRILNLGDLVEIRHSGGQRGRIIEFRGPLGPKGSNIYRVRIRRKPKATYVELPQDQLKPVQVKGGE